MKRSIMWLFVILIPIIAMMFIAMGGEQGCSLAQPPPESDIPDTITVSGAGTGAVNGTYTLQWCSSCGRWEIQDSGSTEFYADGLGSLPDKTGWFVASAGSPDPPTLSW